MVLRICKLLPRKVFSYSPISNSIQPPVDLVTPMSLDMVGLGQSIEEFFGMVEKSLSS